MTQHAQNTAYPLKDLDKVVFQNIASQQALNTPQARIDFLSTQSDDEFLSLTQAQDYCRVSKRTIQRQKDKYQFPNPAVGRTDYNKRHLDFYMQFGGQAWYEVIAKHIGSDIKHINTVSAI